MNVAGVVHRIINTVVLTAGGRDGWRCTARELGGSGPATNRESAVALNEDASRLPSGGIGESDAGDAGAEVQVEVVGVVQVDRHSTSANKQR